VKLPAFFSKKKSKSSGPSIFWRGPTKSLERLLLRLTYPYLGGGGPPRAVGPSRIRTYDLLEGCDGAVLLGHLASVPYLPSSLVTGHQANTIIWKMGSNGIVLWQTMWPVHTVKWYWAGDHNFIARIQHIWNKKLPVYTPLRRHYTWGSQFLCVS